MLTFIGHVSPNRTLNSTRSSSAFPLLLSRLLKKSVKRVCRSNTTGDPRRGLADVRRGGLRRAVVRDFSRLARRFSTVKKMFKMYAVGKEGTHTIGHTG